MKFATLAIAAAAVLLPSAAYADVDLTRTAKGSYVEVRSCDVYTGPCFANGEMGLTGKEAVLVWSVREGKWNGVDLAGLSVIAVVETQSTLGDMSYAPVSGKALLIVDEKADPAQRDALAHMAQTKADGLIAEVVRTDAAAIDAKTGECENSGCATVDVAGVLEIDTRCMGGDDHMCGNEYLFYPPLTEVQHPVAAYSTVARFDGEGLHATWEASGQRNVFLASFGG